MRKYIIIALAAVCLFGLWPGHISGNFCKCF